MAQSEIPAPQLRRSRPFQFGLLAVLLSMVVVAILATLIGAPLARARREAALRTNLRIIGLAFHNYHDLYGCMPPAYIADAQDRPMHSWRVLILHLMGEADAQRVARLYSFNEPWDSPANLAATRRMPAVYRHPLRRDALPETDYLVVTGPGTLFERERACKFFEIRDGLSNTLLVVESFRSGTYWAEPDDLDLESIPLAINPGGGLRGIRGAERERVIVGLADGSAIALPATLDSELLQCLLTRDGGEIIDLTGLRP